RHRRHPAGADPARAAQLDRPGGPSLSRVAAGVGTMHHDAGWDIRPSGKTPRMTVAVIDIGSNTGRLLVARKGSMAAVVAVRNERTLLGLGHEIECTGTISAEKLEQTMAC